MNPLDEVVRSVVSSARQGLRPVVVFDLDSTLFDTAKRNLWILRCWAENGPFREIVAGLPEAEFGWDATRPLLARVALSEGELAELRRFWADHFFTDEAVLHDAPAPGAAAFARAIHDSGGHVYYLTGRHVTGMAAGTAAALTRHGFPLWRGRVTLHLKPTFEMGDERFKAMAVGDIADSGMTVATFDNEPGNCNVFLRAFPDANHFVFGNVRSPNAEVPDPRVVPLAAFTR